MMPEPSDDGTSPGRPVTEHLTVHQCWAALRTADVGRLAISARPWPEVFPVNYVVDHGTIVFRTSPGTKLLALAIAHHVTFEADGFDRSSGRAWSVVIKGRADEIEAPHDRMDALDLPLFPWLTGPKHHFVRIDPVVVTGRRFAASPTELADRLGPGPRRDAGE